MGKTVDKILGSVSPVYGAVSGRGLFGKGLSALGEALGPAAGVLPGAAAAATRRRKRKDGMQEEEGTPAMRKGGKISAKQAVHKHEKAMHKGKPLTKMAKGGRAKKPTLDERYENYYGHGNMNLKARRAMEEAGVKDKRYLPMADWTFEGPRKRLAESDRLRNKPKKYAKGGVAKRADGIAKKGKTKGRMR